MAQALMLALRRLVAGFSIAAILLAACLPGFAPLDCALVAKSCPTTPCDEQPVALLSLGAPRGPPSRHAL